MRTETLSSIVRDLKNSARHLADAEEKAAAAGAEKLCTALRALRRELSQKITSIEVPPPRSGLQ
jgi:hypothetical protein